MSEDTKPEDQIEDVKDDDQKKDLDEPLRPEGLRALQAEREEKKALKAKQAELEAELQAFRDSQKTAEEKQAERLAELEQKATLADRLEIALEKGLTRSQAMRLVGKTVDELKADADTFLAELGQVKSADKEEDDLDDQPKPKLRGGSRPGEQGGSTDPDELARRITARRQ